MPTINWPMIHRAYAPLFCAGLAGMYMKYCLIETNRTGITRSHGVESLMEMSMLTAASYFSLDIIVNFFFVPGVTLLFAFTLFRRKAHILATLVSCALVSFYFVELWAQQNLGQYVSLVMLLEGAQFAQTDWRMAADYVSAVFVLKLVLTLTATVTSSVMIPVLANALSMKWIKNAGKYSLGAFSVAMAVLAISAYPSNPNGLRQDAVRKAITAAFSRTQDSPITRVSTDESILAFRQLTTTPTEIADSNMAGVESGSNLLYFIMETGPADVLPEGDPSELIPRELMQHALVARQHQTTYPYTSTAAH